MKPGRPRKRWRQRAGWRDNVYSAESPFLYLVRIIVGLGSGQGQPKADPEAEGWRLFGQGQYQKAAPLLEAASAASPERAELARASGLCYLRLHNAGEARLAFARLFGVPPDSAKARLLAAKMMMGEQLEEMAERELSAAAKLDPSFPRCISFWGR